MFSTPSLLRTTVKRVDFRHAPLEAADRDQVADLDRLVEQDDEARDVVRGDLLQTEAETDTDRTTEDREDREVDADGAERDDHGEDHEDYGDYTLEDDLDVLGHVLEALDHLVDEGCEPVRDAEREEDGDDRDEKLPDGHTAPADRDDRRIEVLDDVGEDAEELQHGHHPEDDRDDAANARRDHAQPDASLKEGHEEREKRKGVEDVVADSGDDHRLRRKFEDLDDAVDDEGEKRARDEAEGNVVREGDERAAGVADRHADEDGRNLHEHVFKREVLEQPLDHAREALGRRGDDVLRTNGEFRDVHAGVGQVGRNRLSHCCCSV